MPKPVSKKAKKKIKVPVIHVTTDYSIFEKCDDNRQLHLKKHKKLGDSFKKYKSRGEWPIICHRNGAAGKLSVLDGQHRLAIAEAMNLPVFYIITDVDFNIAEINNTQKVWQTIDYAEVYAAKGMKAYQEGIEFCKTHDGVSISVAFALLGGTTSYGNVERAFKDGTFKIIDRDWANEVVGAYCPIAAMSKAVKNTRFLEACMLACRIDDFDSAHMVHAAKNCREKLESWSTREGYLRMMESIYNFRRPKRKLFPLHIKAMQVLGDRDVKNRKKKEGRGKPKESRAIARIGAE